MGERLRTLQGFMLEQYDGLEKIRHRLEETFEKDNTTIPVSLENVLVSKTSEQRMGISKQVLVGRKEDRSQEEWFFITPSPKLENLMPSLPKNCLNEVQQTAALLPIRKNGQPDSQFLVDCAIKTQTLRSNANPQQPLALALKDGGVIRLVYNKGPENWRRRYSLEYYLSVNLAAGEHLYQLSSCDLPGVDFKVLFQPVLLFAVHSHERQRRMKN